MKTINDISKQASKFYDRNLAFSSMNQYVKPMRVMLGVDGRFWVVTPADAERLARLGLEYAV